MRRPFRLAQIATIAATFLVSSVTLSARSPKKPDEGPIPLGTSWLQPTGSDGAAAGRVVARLAALRDGGPGLIAIANGATLSTLPRTDRVRLARALVKIADQPAATTGLSAIVDLIRSGDEISTYASEVALIGLANAHTKEALGSLLRAARGGAMNQTREIWGAFPPRDPSWLVDSAPVALVAEAARNGDLRALEWFAARLTQLKGDSLAEALFVMAELGDERALESARNVVLGPPRLLAVAVLVLKTFNAKDANARLIALMQPLGTRGHAFGVAIRTKSAEILPFALQIDPAEAPSTVEMRIAYLALMGGSAATATIGKFLTDLSLTGGKAKIAETAAQTLGAMRTRDSLEALAKVTTGKALLVARGPAFLGYVLHRQGGGPAHPAIERELLRMLISQREDERGVAVRVLGENGNDLSWTTLQGDKSIFVREQLAIVLSERGPLSVLQDFTKKTNPKRLRSLALSARVLRDDPELSLRTLEDGAPPTLSTYWTVRHNKLSQCTIADADIVSHEVRIGMVLGCIARKSKAAQWALLQHLPVEPDARLRFSIMRELRADAAHEASVVTFAETDPDRSIRNWARGGAEPSKELESRALDTRANVSLWLTFSGYELEPQFEYTFTPPPSPTESLLDEILHE